MIKKGRAFTQTEPVGVFPSGLSAKYDAVNHDWRDLITLLHLHQSGRPIVPASRTVFELDLEKPKSVVKFRLLLRLPSTSRILTGSFFWIEIRAINRGILIFIHREDWKGKAMRFQWVLERKRKTTISRHFVCSSSPHLATLSPRPLIFSPPRTLVFVPPHTLSSTSLSSRHLAPLLPCSLVASLVFCLAALIPCRSVASISSHHIASVIIIFRITRVDGGH